MGGTHLLPQELPNLTHTPFPSLSIIVPYTNTLNTQRQTSAYGRTARLEATDVEVMDLKFICLFSK